jgi:hypothetical protein
VINLLLAVPASCSVVPRWRRYLSSQQPNGIALVVTTNAVVWVGLFPYRFSGPDVAFLLVRADVVHHPSQEASRLRQVELMASYPEVPASGQRLAIKVDA